MAFFLALDAGGTKTDYVLADETRELARVRSGTIKRLRIDAPTAARNLETALSELTQISGVSMRNIARTCIGTAGNTVPLVTDWLRHEIASRIAGELILVGDVEIALDAAFQGGPGVLVLAGTGSNIAGRGRDGKLLGAGGWGPALADQGSGHRIGHAGLRAAFLAKDENKPTSLMDAAMKFWQIESEDRMVEYANSTPAPDFSRLTEVVVHCALNGDTVAAAVLKKEGEDLGYLVKLVLRRLYAADSHLTPSLAFAGSIMEKVPLVRDALINFVQQEFPTVGVLEGVIDPIAGALWRARVGNHL